MINQINDWISFIKKPRQELGGFPVCPYAKQATDTNSYILEKVSLETVENAIEGADLAKYMVIILALPTYENHSVEDLLNKTQQLNEKYKYKDCVILDNDPRTPMIIQGVTTSFKHCYLWILQSLSDLNKKSDILSKTSYYGYWTQKQLDEVVTWRK